MVPARSALGTWRTHAALSQDDVMRVPAGLSVQQAAVLSIKCALHTRALWGEEAGWPAATQAVT